MKQTPSPQNQEHDQEIIELLKGLESLRVEYPAELLAARRAAFVAQVKQDSGAKAKKAFPVNGEFTKRLKEFKSVKTEYPPELLAARRAAFIAQVEQRSGVEITEELSSKDEEIIKLFRTLKSSETTQYPAKLMAARRVAFKRQIVLGGSVSLLETIRSAIGRLSLFKFRMPSIPTMSVLRTGLIVAILMVAAFATTLFRNREPVLSPLPTQGADSPTDLVATVTSTGEAATIICKPGDRSPLCPTEELDKSQDLAFQGNGAARPAVAKDASSSGNGDHKASNVNDGRDGVGWVSNSAYSWIKIDLGNVATIDTVTLDKASLSSFRDHNVGQFVIAVALSDIYADGNSSNDYTEYTQVYDSEQTNFSGVISESETVRAIFGPVRARFVKITFKDAGTAINEVRVFMAQPPSWSVPPTKRREDDQPPALVATSRPIYNTPVPPTAIPPTRPLPTNTSVPTDPPPPTSTPRPPNTPTPVPPTDIPPTDIPPTDIPPTDAPPTDAPPTDIPPTDIPAIDTPIQQSIDTSQPTVVSAEASVPAPVAGP
jgi:hypothetical protein